MKKFIVLVAVIFIVSGCHRMIPGVKFVQPSVMQSEIERFEQAKGIPCADVPIIYDISPLKVGSMVKSKMVDSRMPDQSFLLSTTLNDIEVISNGKQYQIKTDTESSTADIFTNQLSSKIVCIDDTETEPKRNMQLKGEEDILEKERNQIITDVVVAGIMGGPLASGIATHAGIRKYNITKEVHEKFPEVRQEMEARTEKETKLTDFKLISEEKLIISGRPVPCKVYQSVLMTMTKSPSYNKGVFNFQSSTNIMYESKKLWISDEIPFGIAKSEMKVSAISQTNSQVIKMDEASIISEVVEFKY